MDEIAEELKISIPSVFVRIRARGVPYLVGKRRVIFIKDGDVPTLALTPREWRERAGVG